MVDAFGTSAVNQKTADGLSAGRHEVVRELSGDSLSALKCRWGALTPHSRRLQNNVVRTATHPGAARHPSQEGSQICPESPLGERCPAGRGVLGCSQAS